MAAIESNVPLDPALPEGWAVDDDHEFVGMSVIAHTDSGDRDGRIGAFWVYDGRPARIDVVLEDGSVLNCARADVEVTR